MIEQEAQLNPPLKRFWGPGSIGVIGLFLGLTLLFPSVKKEDTQPQAKPTATVNLAPALARPNEQGEPPQVLWQTTVKPDDIQRFQVEIIEDLNGINLTEASYLRPLPPYPPLNHADTIDRTDPILQGYSEVKRIEESGNAAPNLLKRIPLRSQSQDGTATLAGYLSIWVSDDEDQLFWRLSFDVATRPAD